MAGVNMAGVKIEPKSWVPEDREYNVCVIVLACHGAQGRGKTSFTAPNSSLCSMTCPCAGPLRCDLGLS